MHLQIKVARKTGKSIEPSDLDALLEAVEPVANLAGIVINVDDGKVRLVPVDDKLANEQDTVEPARTLVEYLNDHPNGYIAEEVDSKLLTISHEPGALRAALQPYLARLESVLVLAGVASADHPHPDPTSADDDGPPMVHVSIGLAPERS